MSNRTYGLDFDLGWNLAHDPQAQPVNAETGICLMCGEVFPADELERNDGLCLPCYYKAIEPDPDDGDGAEEEAQKCSGKCEVYYNCKGGCGCGTHEPCAHAIHKAKGGGENAGKR